LRWPWTGSRPGLLEVGTRQSLNQKCIRQIGTVAVAGTASFGIVAAVVDIVVGIVVVGDIERSWEVVGRNRIEVVEVVEVVGVVGLGCPSFVVVVVAAEVVAVGPGRVLD
jgi:hypothetical protein